MAKANAVWGIDVGQCALKALRCTVAENGDHIVADKYDYIEYPKILSQSIDQQNELIAETLEQFLSRNEVKGDTVAISVSGQAGLSRFFKPPPVDARKLPDIVRYEVKQQIPFPIEDVIWDWQRLGGTVIDDITLDAEVGLFAMKRDAVFRALQPFTDEKIEVDIVQLAPLATYNVVCHDILENIPDSEDVDPDNPPESLVVLSIGTDTTDLIVTNGIKLWLRNIPIGGNHFTKQLARELKLTYAKAELLKRNARKAEDPKTVFQAMRPVFNDMVTEIQRSLTFFQSMEKNSKIKRIALFGNAAKLPGLRQFLTKQLELEIVKISSFKKLDGPGVIDQSSFQGNVLSLAPCYGLCLQGLSSARLNTNLLPHEFVMERMVRAKKPWILASVGALAIAFMVGWLFISRAWWGVNENFEVNDHSWKEVAQRVDTSKNRSNTLVSIDKQQNAELQQINTINDQLVSAADLKYSWMEMFSLIYQALPKDERITTDAVDPAAVPFEDRKEVFIDHIETKYYADLYDWYLQVKPIYDEQYNYNEKFEEFRQKAKLAGKQDVTTTKSKVKKSKLSDILKLSRSSAAAASTGPKRAENALQDEGFVIEIKAHHFHNSNEALNKDGLIKQDYVLETFVKNLIDLEFKFPGEDSRSNGGGKYKTTDLGIFYPTLVSYERVLKPTVISVAPISKDKSDKGEQNVDTQEDPVEKPSTFQAQRFDFVVQFAWKPRSPQERYDARKKRIEQETKEAKSTARRPASSNKASNQPALPTAKTKTGDKANQVKAKTDPADKSKSNDAKTNETKSKDTKTD